MLLLSQDDFAALTEAREGPCVSIYLPTHKAGKATEENPIRLKNALRKAQTQLEAMGLRSTEAQDLLAPGQALVTEGGFWRRQDSGLALFLACEFHRSYRLPLAFDEAVVVADRFYIKPLMPLINQDGYFYLLALSQDEVRLFRGTAYDITPVELRGVPESLAEALQYNVEEKQLQFSSFTGDIKGRPGIPSQNTAMFHGHGQAADLAYRKEQIREFLTQLDNGLQDVLRCERAPMVLAGVQYVQDMYRGVSRYPNILDTGITGNPELLKKEQLHERAWPLVEPEFRRRVDEAMAKYRDMLGGGRVSTDVPEIVRAAAVGRVDTLFMTDGVKFWGTYDPDSGDVAIHLQREPGSKDLLDQAALDTFMNRGCVVTLKPEEMPDEGALAAIFRY
jgi:hypothetical protein